MAIIPLTKDNFDAEIQNAAVPVVIDFWATWCGPCKMQAPILEEIDKEQAEHVKVCKVNVDEQPELAAKFGIMSIPTLFFYRNGQNIGKLIGLRSKDEILKILLP